MIAANEARAHHAACEAHAEVARAAGNDIAEASYRLAAERWLGVVRDAERRERSADAVAGFQMAQIQRRRARAPTDPPWWVYALLAILVVSAVASIVLGLAS